MASLNNNEDIIIGRLAFLEPEITTSPESFLPPLINSFCIFKFLEG
jgi:hypothetical protein